MKEEMNDEIEITKVHIEDFEEITEGWVYALSDYLNLTKINHEVTGQWLIPVKNNFNEEWEFIEEATSEGKLGIESSANLGDKKFFHITTADLNDVEDVAKVAWNIYQLGICPVVLNYIQDTSLAEDKYACTDQVILCSLNIHHFSNKTEEEFIEFFKGRYG